MQLCTLSFITLSPFLSLNLSTHDIAKCKFCFFPRVHLALTAPCPTIHTCTSSNSACSIQSLLWHKLLGEFPLDLIQKAGFPKEEAWLWTSPIVIDSFSINVALKIFVSPSRSSLPHPQREHGWIALTGSLTPWGLVEFNREYQRETEGKEGILKGIDSVGPLLCLLIWLNGLTDCHPGPKATLLPGPRNQFPTN